MLGKDTDKKIKRVKEKFGFTANGIIGLLYILFIMAFVILPSLLSFIRNLFESKESKLNRIKKLLDNAKEFNKKDNTEAYADNIARMYGYGAALMKGLKKICGQNEEIYFHSYKEKSKRREKAVLNMYIDALKDVHGTDVQRIMSLIKEYDADLKDDSIPDSAKKWIKTDKEQMEALLDEYVNNKDRLKATVNKMIKEAMDDKNPNDNKDAKKDK
jgi:hypothetical protein